MGKSLSQTIAELYKPKSKEEQDFVDKHVVDKIPDANGNGDEVFKGNATKKDKSKKNDLSPEDQEKVYEDSELEEKNDKNMKDDPCWDSHEMVGHKIKDGKKVPNCVPSVKEDMISSVMASVLGKMQEDIDSVTEATMKLDRVNIVQFDDNTKKFAKDYVAGNKGDYAQGGPSDKDEKNSEKFHSTYAMKTLKSGYAGSGEFVYTNKKTGESFKVVKSANGKGFHGTDHVIMKLNEDIDSVTEGSGSYSTAAKKANSKRQVAINKARAWMKKTGKSAKEAVKEFDLFDSDIKNLDEGSVSESHLSYAMPYGSMPGVMPDTDDNEEDMDIAADLDAEVLEAMVRSATFKLDYIHSVIENEECDIPNHLKFDIQSMKECVDRVYMEIRHCMNEDVDVSESTELEEAKRNYGTDPESVKIKAEYDALNKLPIKKLREIIVMSRRGPIDASEYRVKDHAISDLLRNEYGNKKFAKAMGLDESTELEEANFPSKGRKWSEHVKYSIDNNTASKPNKIAKGKDFDVYIRYGGSIKRTPHFVVRDDVIIGGGYTLPSALKDAGLKPKDVTVFSKYPEGSRLNTMKEKEELDELSRNKLKDYAAKSGDHADKMNKEINTSKGDARVANIRKNMSTIKKRNAGKDLAFKKLGTGNNSYSPNAKVSASKNEEFDLDEAQEKIADKIKDLSPANQKKAQELAKTEEGMKKLLDFIAKLETE